MDYKHKSGSQKRKEKQARNLNAKKGQKSLTSLGFISNDKHEDQHVRKEIDCEETNNLNNNDKHDKHMDQQVQKETDLGDRSNSNNFIAEAAEVEIENLPICEKNDCEVNAINNTVNKIDIGKINSIQMSGAQIEDAVLHGPELNPQQFPKDINGNHFPTKIFEASLANGEKVKRDWLVWSKTKNALFCFPCRLFSKLPDNQRSVLATCSGYSNEKLWKKLYEKIPNHENSHSHKACYVDWRQFELRIHKHMSVDLQLVESIKNEAKTWIAILQRILDVVLYLGERGLAFRGSNELIGDPKNGNFLGSLELISHYDTIMHDHLEKVKESQKIHKRLQVHYLSPESQNEFIDCCANHVRQVILEERERAKYYSIIVDATPDSAHIEQTVFILRYVLLNENSHRYEIQERFLEFADCNKKTGKAIAELIQDTLRKHQIPLADCRGQGYDNGSNMSGQYKGAQREILNNNPFAIFSPCGCHTLNLCGVQAAECCPQVLTFFGVVQKLFNIFSSSPQRWEILQKKIGCSLHSLSQTRWSARVECVKPFAAHIPGITEAIIEIETLNLTPETRFDIKGIKTYMESFECTLLASIWLKVLTTINYRSTILQARDSTLDVEVNNIKSLLKDLQALRNQWASILTECKLVAANTGISATFEEKRRKIRKRQFDESIDQESDSDPETHFKQTVFYVIIDCLIGNLTRRFDAINELNNRFSIFWKYRSLDKDELKIQAESFCQHYNADVSIELIEEIAHLKTIHDTNIDAHSLSPFQLLNKLQELNIEVLFPNICIALRIYCTIPVTVAEAERSFSLLARIKNFLRSTMGQNRLTNLGTLALEPLLSRKLNFDSIISTFAKRKARKALLNKFD